MVLFCAAIKWYSISLLRFPFPSHAQILPCVISSVCRLKHLYSCFSFHFSFLVFVHFLSVFMLSPLQLVVAINLSLFFLKSDLTDKMKRSFFKAVVVSILLYGCTTRTLTKRLEKKLDANYTWMLRAILNKSWRQHPTTRHAGHYWRSRDELIGDVHLWTPTYGRAGRPARTYIQQLCEDTGCGPEDLPKAMNDREKWWERVRDIRASGAKWWWWWWWCPS